MVRTLAVVGYSNTGKTTVARQLAVRFQQQGVKVAVLKHASHGYEPDAEGKDTRSYYDAGLMVVAVAGPQSFSIHRRTPVELELDDLLVYFSDCDLLVVEGYKNHPGPKVELLRRGVSEARLGLSGVVAVVADLPDVEAEEPVFTYDEIDELAEYLRQQVFGP